MLVAEMLEVECADVLALEGQLLAVTVGLWVLAALEAKVLTLLEIGLLSEGTEKELCEAIETSANVSL